MTVAEAALALRLSVPAVYKLVAGEILPAARVGRSIRLSSRSLAAFVAAGGKGWPGGWRRRTAVGGVVRR